MVESKLFTLAVARLLLGATYSEVQMDIGEPIRRVTVVPLKTPVRAPEPERVPLPVRVPEPERVPEKVDA